MFNSVGTMHVAFTSPVLWLNIILICGFSGLIEYFILSFFFVFKPTTASLLQRIYNQQGVIDSEKNLPKSIIENINLYNQIEENLENMEIKNDDIGINNNIKTTKDKEEESNKKEKEEDEKSEEIRLNRDDIEEAKTDFGKDKEVNLLKNNRINTSKVNNKENQEEFEDIGENYEDNFSERMSKEGNINIKSSNYFKKSWNLKK